VHGERILGDLRKENSRLLNLLYESKIANKISNEDKVKISELGEKELEILIKHEADLENSIKSSAVEAKQSEKNIDRLDPIEQTNIS